MEEITIPGDEHETTDESIKITKVKVNSRYFYDKLHPNGKELYMYLFSLDIDYDLNILLREIVNVICNQREYKYQIININLLKDFPMTKIELIEDGHCVGCSEQCGCECCKQIYLTTPNCNVIPLIKKYLTGKDFGKITIKELLIVLLRLCSVQKQNITIKTSELWEKMRLTDITYECENLVFSKIITT